MKNHEKIEQEAAEKMGLLLKGGARLSIAKKTGYSPTYVSMVLSGKVPVNASNQTIIDEARKMLRNLEKQNEFVKKLNNDTKTV